jgi:acyl carrier protein
VTRRLEELVREQFPDAIFDSADPSLGVGSFPEWDSLGTFNLLLLAEQTYSVRFSTAEMAELKTVAAIRKHLKSLGIEA